MKTVQALLIAAVVVAIWDRAAMYRIGSYSDAYRYWPLSKLRFASVFLVFIAATLTLIFGKDGPGDPPIWPFFVAGGAIVIWAVVGVIDVVAQDRRKYRPPQALSEHSERQL